MYKVRFNLGKGPRFMTWKITFPDGHHEYLQPDEVTLILIKAKLKNQRGTAEKIHEGANKRVCAWVECEDLKIKDKYRFSENLSEISYNPRIAPYWRDTKGNDVDNSYYGTMRTLGNKVFEVVHGNHDKYGK